MATTQRERHAAQAREKMEARRDDADGAAGWVAQRAGEWSDSMPVIARGRRLAKLLQLEKVARLKMFPIALSAPWGLSPAILPELPLPTKIRTAFQDPVRFEVDPDRASDDDYVNRKYREVRRSIQTGMDTLARRRAFPLFG